MQRRKFLTATALSLGSITIAQKAEALPGRTSKGFVVKAAESRFGEKTLINGSSPNDIKVSSKDTNGAVSIFEYTGNGKGGPPLHVHTKQDEIFFIIEGEYLFQVGDDKYTLKAGDTIFLPRSVPHAFAQLTDKGKMFFLFQPSGKMEDFFRAIGKLSGPTTAEQGARIFSEHDMKVVGPPLQY